MLLSYIAFIYLLQYNVQRDNVPENRLSLHKVELNYFSTFYSLKIGSICMYYDNLVIIKI